MVVREARPGLELLFIRRAEHPLDPWSGHMAFPGGRVDPGDENALAAAYRETREELGLDLRTARLLGRLSTVPVMARGRRLPMVIEPFVFELEGPQPRLTLNYEVDEALWIPFDHLGDPGRRSTFRLTHRETPITLPCCLYEGRRIWGLTLRMVNELLEAGAVAPSPTGAG